MESPLDRRIEKSLDLESHEGVMLMIVHQLTRDHYSIAGKGRKYL